MTTKQAISKSMATCRSILGNVQRSEFLKAMSDKEISVLITAKIQLNRGLKPPKKPRSKFKGKQMYFNFTQTNERK